MGILSKLRSKLDNKIGTCNAVKYERSILIAILLGFGLYFNVPLQEWAILIAVIIFIVVDTLKQTDFWENQEDILIQIYDDIKYLLRENGHINYFRSCITPNGYPHHNILKLNLNFYLTSLAHKINGITTLELKNKLKEANDKINMLNNYRKDENTWEKMLIHMQSKYEEYGYLREILKELRDRLEEIQKIIKEEFKIKGLNTKPEKNNQD